MHGNRPQILLLNYPNNPIGTTYSAKELKGIAGVVEKYQILVLSDEIYGEVHYEGKACFNCFFLSARYGGE